MAGRTGASGGTRRTLRRLGLGAVLSCLACSACAGPPPRMIEEPRLPVCRSAVDAASRPAGAAVRWFAPESPADRASHATWCATVGPLVVEPQPPAGATRGATPVPDGSAGDAGAGRPALAIVAWNTHVGGADLVSFVGDLRAGRWSDGRPVPHFVLLLQEVFRRGRDVPRPPVSAPVPRAIRPEPPPSGRLDVVEIARRLELSLFYAPSMRNGTAAGDAAEDRGNAVLSTLPLSGFRVVELPFERQRRVAVAAAVAADPVVGAPLLVVSAHLDNRGARRRLLVLSPAGRTRQARGLVAALPAEAPAVLGGDFNTWLWGREGALGALRRAFPDTPPGSGATYASLRLDYLFFRLPPRWRASWGVIDERLGSDHDPVLGWVAAPAVRR